MSDETDDFMGPSEVAEVDAAADVDGANGLDGAADDSGSRSLLSPLFNTEPNVSPRDASGAFDPEVSWHKDLECALLKISGSGGMPAIGHLLVAAAKVGMGQDVSLPSIRGGNDNGGGERRSRTEPDVTTGEQP